MTSHLQGFLTPLYLQTFCSRVPAAMVKVAGAMGKSAEVMKTVNSLMKVADVQKAMQEMSKGAVRDRWMMKSVCIWAAEGKREGVCTECVMHARGRITGWFDAQKALQNMPTHTLEAADTSRQVTVEV